MTEDGYFHLISICRKEPFVGEIASIDRGWLLSTAIISVSVAKRLKGHDDLMKMIFAVLAFLCCLPFAAAQAADAEAWRKMPDCVRAVEQRDFMVARPEPDAKVHAALDQEVAGLKNPAWAASYCVALNDNLLAKANSMREGAVFSSEVLIATAIQYEGFRIQAFHDSAVSPKRFFGFLDEQGKSAVQENVLKDVATRAAGLLNAYGAKNGIKTTVTPKEIIVTHLAEGGAKLLTTDFANVETIDPVFGVGLDDFRIGFKFYPGLIQEVDSAFNTKLEALSNTWPQSGHMSFAESVLGTAVMYFYEKDLAEKKLADKGLPGLEGRSLDEQYVIASLVYNSGILFDQDRVKMIMDFQTADYLFDVSEKTAVRATNPRPRLPVLNVAGNDALLQRGETLPLQLTSWSAVYHILQRYGAWMALSRFSSHFDAVGNVKL